ncbi:unnamed protein product [Penicillium salamii]|uniref:Uncharacterized protein n=1 Tax=Penicillium salamii TaxID=1612424 RepID=A0A9W4J8X0_9EURO|nr:unnamed protein product [Penicillium salamii]CAG8253575.1 unnamed protein product [Penicillium salamii]CAG8278252.1 unnamed protein product [Penicillium salamii]CAG8382576.1 unnamed protein product [Penicillium salamii]CAG8386654.1 unnamed protein product [Penicillium salamii]
MMSAATKSRVSATATGTESKSTNPIPPAHQEPHASPPIKSKMDEDLRPTPNELVEAKAGLDTVTHAQTDPKKAKAIARAAVKRAKPIRRQTTSAKRRKPNSTKTNAANRGNTIPQLPLITVAKSALAAPIEQTKPSLPDNSNAQTNATATKDNVDLPKASLQTSPSKDDQAKHLNHSQRVSVEIRSCSPVASISSFDLDYHVKGPSHGQMISILEHRAQMKEQSNQERTMRMVSETCTSSTDVTGKPALADSSKLTILESRMLPKAKPKPKVVRKSRSFQPHKPRGRAQSVGSKLMLALHKNENSQPGPVLEDQVCIIISSDAVQPESPKIVKQCDVTANSPPKPMDAEQIQHSAIRAANQQHLIKPEKVRSSSPVVVDDTKEVEVVDATGGMASWGYFLSSLGHSEGSSTEDSDVEIGRGLIDDEPSILDYHMEMEHLSGFQSLRPIISERTTSSQLTKLCESQMSTSSGTPSLGRNDPPAATVLETCESSHTPESQKPLLRGERSVMQKSSPLQPRSVPKTSIVDRNGSPRLLPLLATETIPYKVDYNAGQENADLETSPSRYDRSSSSHCTESSYGGVVWTKFQRDMLIAYGVETDKLARSHWPSVKPRPSLSQDIADGARSDQESTTGRLSLSSQRTIEERGLDAPPDRPFDRSFRTDISGSTQPDVKSHRSSDEDPMEWISTLQAAQKDAHHLLHQTNSNLSEQLAAEKATITRVLGIYREGCGRILDDLFKVQEARMQLYKQQIQQVKEQHADICQDLVRGLQELDRRVQQGPI